MTAADHPSNVPDVVDLDAVAGWMDGVGLPGGAITDAAVLSGGTQNILVRFRRGDRTFVFRRGPEHLRPKSNDTMRREMRVLAALDGSGVPHPGFIAGCPDETVLGGAAFYLMEPIDGFNPTVELPALHAHDATVRHEMGLRAVDALAALGAVDHVAVGLDDLGRPDGFLERQVPRWLSELDAYGRHDGYPGPAIPGLDEVAAWLDSHRPSTFTPGLSHGDFHLANLLFRFDGPGVAAIVDWEMCTVGDPLLDLGWLLATWPSAESIEGDGGATAVTGAIALAGGLARPDELVARYAERSARDLTAIRWYEVLAGFKLGIVLEGTHARAFAGKASKEVGDVLHTATLGLFDRAVRRIHATS